MGQTPYRSYTNDLGGWVGYARPHDLNEALAILAGTRPVILAGGTDVYPARVGRPFDDDILDITAIAGLREIRREGGAWRVPALATWSDLIAADLPPAFDGLKQAAREVGGVQIQNAGTVCGNLCNASPAADGAPNLLALDAQVELASRRAARRLALTDFLLGNRRTALVPDEMMTAILVPEPAPGTRATFKKLGARRYLVISIAMVAAVVTVADGVIADARVAVGACSAVARRLPALEQALRGRPARAASAMIATPEHLADLAPIDDIRAPAAYRRDVALTLVRRALAEVLA